MQIYVNAKMQKKKTKCNKNTTNYDDDNIHIQLTYPFISYTLTRTKWKGNS